MTAFREGEGGEGEARENLRWGRTRTFSGARNRGNVARFNRQSAVKVKWGCTHAHARFPGILCFDGAINRRKAAVKRIESQVRPFCWPRAISSLTLSLSPRFSQSFSLSLYGCFSFFLPSSFLSRQMSLRDPAPFARLSLSHAFCSLARPARSGPSARHYVTNVTAVRRSVDCHVPRLFGVVCAAS